MTGAAGQAGRRPGVVAPASPPTPPTHNGSRRHCCDGPEQTPLPVLALLAKGAAVAAEK